MEKTLHKPWNDAPDKVKDAVSYFDALLEGIEAGAPTQITSHTALDVRTGTPALVLRAKTPMDKEFRTFAKLLVGDEEGFYVPLPSDKWREAEEEHDGWKRKDEQQYAKENPR